MNSVIPRHSRKAGGLAWIAALFLAFLLGHVPIARAAENFRPWTLLDPDARIPAVPAERSAIVVLKLADAVSPVAPAGRDTTVSVLVDGTYQASVPLASWTYAEVCPGTHRLSAVRDDTILAFAHEQPTGQQFNLAPASVSYFQLLEDEMGAPRLQAVEPVAARTAAEQLPRAAHTISRLQSGDCTPPPPTVLPVADARPGRTLVTNYTLRSSAFFAFDQSLLDSRHNRGQAELDEIIQKMRATYSSVQAIELFGYADPTGGAAYNLVLSQKRADAVATYMKQAGFGSAVITAKGMGATDLVVPDCGIWLKTPQKIQACNEPNRRVKLLVHGTPRN